MSIAVHDGTALRDAQGKVIAHCEAMADRMAILDTPPDLIPSDALDWRVNEAGYDSKQATLYYPWLEVMSKLVGPAGPGSAVWTRRRHMGTDGCNPRSAQGASEQGILRVTGLGFQARPPSRVTGPRRPELHPLVPGAWDPGVGCAHDLE